MRNRVQLCFAANNILLMRNWNQALVWKWQIASLSFQRVIWHLDLLTTVKSRYFAQVHKYTLVANIYPSAYVKTPLPFSTVFDGFSRETSLVSRETRRVSRETRRVSIETSLVSRETRRV